jgi:hypothetical protein
MQIGAHVAGKGDTPCAAAVDKSDAERSQPRQGFERAVQEPGDNDQPGARNVQRSNSHDRLQQVSVACRDRVQGRAA